MYILAVHVINVKINNMNFYQIMSSIIALSLGMMSAVWIYVHLNEISGIICGVATVFLVAKHIINKLTDGMA